MTPIFTSFCSSSFSGNAKEADEQAHGETNAA